MKFPRLNILLVEDEALIRMDMALILTDWGHSVSEACNASSALSVLLQLTKIDLLVTDINMPGAMNGLALAFDVRGQLPECHILVLSGNLPPNAEEMPCRSRFLSKPVNTDDLSCIMEAFLTA
ncbi:response regulator [Roseovarius confluentis]|uniref:response regulator n=1 Tax=Roseovarius confluentis TaxID=1852027 RepID=UPI0014741FDC|nr:response regulator [Roseovarius confluentis]